MLDLLKVEKAYGRNVVLNIPSLHLDHGIYWVQGANGSGKTTLLKLIAGLLPFVGDIMVNNFSLHDTPVKYRQNVSWSDAEPLYPDFLTGNDLLKLYQKIRKTPANETQQLISLLRMEHYIGTRTGTYSSGMLKKLSLLLAFTGYAPLILLDEPFTTLDKEAAPVVMQLIMDTHLHHGTSFFLSSHQPLDTGALKIDKQLSIANQTINFIV